MSRSLPPQGLQLARLLCLNHLLISTLLYFCSSHFYTSVSGFSIPPSLPASSLPLLSSLLPSFLYFLLFLSLFFGVRSIIFSPTIYQMSPTECKVDITSTVWPKIKYLILLHLLLNLVFYLPHPGIQDFHLSSSLILDLSWDVLLSPILSSSRFDWLYLQNRSYANLPPSVSPITILIHSWILIIHSSPRNKTYSNKL